MNTLDVALGARSYPIHIGAGLLGRAGALLAPRLASRRVIVVTNPVVAGLWLPTLREGLTTAGVESQLLEIPDGETHKNWDMLHDVVSRLLEMRAERSTTVLALGGGVVGDLAGFAAAICQRGMPFVQIPTTLLAQVDSSVGGKTGVNHAAGKNMIGAFYQPQAVLIDIDCLGTLPRRELSAGLAEVIKCGAIRSAEFFAWLEQNLERLLAREPDALEYAVSESCRIKAEIVAADEREAGERALLNFGHTFGHAIEAGLGYGAWLHGEAVGAGMVIAAEVSRLRGTLPASDAQRLRCLIERAGLPVAPPSMPFDRWMELMARDKKVAAGAVRFVLLDGLGQAVVAADVSTKDLGAALRCA
jgi:3-dehydroquinate synthase